MANQTHKTIIFEEFDSTRDNLFTILNSDPSSAKLATEIEEKLLVKSFAEFMKKFAPKVYEVALQDKENNTFQFFYTTDPTKFSDYRYFEFSIDEHAFYKMLLQLYTTRGIMGQANAKFDDKEIMDMLSPKKELEDMRNLRGDMEYNLKLYYEAKAKGDKSEMNTARAKVKKCKKKIAEYASSPLNKLFPLLIEDIDKKLKLLAAPNSSGNNNGDAPKALPSYGQLYLTESGELDILDNKKFNELKALSAPKGGSLVVADDKHPAKITNLPANLAQNKSASPVPEKQDLQNQIAEAIVKDYEKNTQTKSETIKSLIVSTFAPLAKTQKTDVAELDENKLRKQKETYEKAYAGARQSFANEMTRIVESLLGVKTFFDHATVDGDDSSEIPAGVIIANCKASKLLGLKDNKFASYMKYLGKAQMESRIWFAVVPSVLEEPPTANIVVEGDDDPLNDIWDDEEENSVLSGEDYVSVNALKEFIKVMDDAKIMTVFNIRVKGGNTFADLNAAEVQSKIKTFDQCDYSHAAYAYPNFTLIRERDLKPFDGQDNTKITLPGVFIDAAYPAAGLLVASQQAKVLDSKRLKYDKESPCVSVNLEDIQVKKKLPTKFNRESILRRSEDLIKAINEKMFGFAFSGDEIRDGDGVWKNTYVHCARTLAKNKKDGNYKPIYKTLVEDYIGQSVMGLVSNKKSHVEKMIVKKINNEYAEKNGQERYKNDVNLILHEGEYLYIGNADGKDRIFVHFAEGDDSCVENEVESD